MPNLVFEKKQTTGFKTKIQSYLPVQNRSSWVRPVVDRTRPHCLQIIEDNPCVEALESIIVLIKSLADQTCNETCLKDIFVIVGDDNLFGANLPGNPKREDG